MGHVSELWKMGANIEVEGNTAIITGVENLLVHLLLLTILGQVRLWW